MHQSVLRQQTNSLPLMSRSESDNPELSHSQICEETLPPSLEMCSRDLSGSDPPGKGRVHLHQTDSRDERDMTVVIDERDHFRAADLHMVILHQSTCIEQVMSHKERI